MWDSGKVFVQACDARAHELHKSVCVLPQKTRNTALHVNGHTRVTRTVRDASNGFEPTTLRFI